MNRLNNIFSFIICGFLFSTTIQAQSLLKKTLKVLDAVNEINKTNNTSKEQNSKQNNVQLNTTSPNGFRGQAENAVHMLKLTETSVKNFRRRV